MDANRREGFLSSDRIRIAFIRVHRVPFRGVRDSAVNETMSTREPSIRKAAVLVASLDVDTADMLLGQMPPQQADEVRREVLELGELDPVEQKRVIDEFFRIGPLMPEQEPPGLQLDDAVLNRLARPIDEYVPTISSPALQHEEPQFDSSRHDHSRQHKFEVPSAIDHSHSNDPPFSFLHDAEPEALVPLLEREHPQAIALVLAHLPAERAGHVLARLPAAMQTDVIRRLVDMEETDPHVVRDVERAVAAWLNRRQPAATPCGRHGGGVGNSECVRWQRAAANSEQFGNPQPAAGPQADSAGPPAAAIFVRRGVRASVECIGAHHSRGRSPQCGVGFGRRCGRRSARHSRSTSRR